MILPLVAPKGQISVTSLLLKNPHAKEFKEMKAYADKLIMHNTGRHKDKYIEKMDYFEKPELLELRKKYSPTNEDFFGRLHRPLDKVFNAKGGSANYYLPDSQKGQLLGILKDVHNGYSMKMWLRTFWMPAYNYDPNGLVFMEVGDGVSYPTYKCIEDIYTYPITNARELPYVIFCVDKKEVMYPIDEEHVKYYRVVDDATDRLVEWDGENAKVIDEYTNFYGKVPAIKTGNIYDSVKGWFVSPDDSIIDMADQFMRERSVLTMFVLHHGFPIKWAYKSKCPTCQGTGKLAADACPSCNGSTLKSKFDVAETIGIPVPTSKDDPILAPDIAGYVSPPIDSWKEMVNSLDEKYRSAHFSRWGTHQQEDSSNETATGRFIDVQPVNESLGYTSDAAEDMDKWITDMLGMFYFEGSYKGCEVNYGRRFLIESPDEIWAKYQDARKNGVASIGSLNNLLMQYIMSEYQSDSMEMIRQIKMMKLEPFVHMTVEQAKNNVTNPLDYNKKLYFGEWINQLGENDLIIKDYKTLNAEFTDYVEALNIEEPEEEETIIS